MEEQCLEGSVSHLNLGIFPTVTVPQDSTFSPRKIQWRRHSPRVVCPNIMGLGGHGNHGSAPQPMDGNQWPQVGRAGGLELQDPHCSALLPSNCWTLEQLSSSSKPQFPHEVIVGGNESSFIHSTRIVPGRGHTFSRRY